MPKEEPIYDQDGKLIPPMVITKKIKDDPSKPVKDVKYYVVSGAEAMNAIVDTVGENNAAMAILVLQFSVQGAVRTVTSVATEQVKDIIFGGAKSIVSDYFAKDVLNVNDERWTPSQQDAIYSLSDASGNFLVDTIISGGAFGIIKGAKNVGKANEGYNSSVNTHDLSLLDDKATTHILDGESSTSGGHRYGTGNPGKTEFPKDWSDTKIKNVVSDIATDPNVKWKPRPNGYEVATKNVDGIDIQVIYDPKKGRIVSAYPTNTPKNPK